MALDPRTRIASVTLRVNDPERVLSLYRDALGLDYDGDPLVRLHQDEDAEPAPPHTAGLFHTAIRFPTRAALADALRRVARAGFELTGASDHGVREALYLDDPEGNGVELYWDRDPERWPRHLDGTVAMYTLPLDLRSLIREAEETDAAPPETDIGHVHFKVADVGRTVGFWRDALGMDLQALLGDQAAFLSVGGYHHNVGANTWHSRGAPPLPEGARGLEKVTFELPTATALKRALSGARRAKVEADKSPLIDPDGIPIELVAAS